MKLMHHKKGTPIVDLPPKILIRMKLSGEMFVGNGSTYEYTGYTEKGEYVYVDSESDFYWASLMDEAVSE